MKVKELTHAAADIFGSIRAASDAHTVGNLIRACQTQLAIERAIAAGDRLQARQTLREAFRDLGWQWNTNALWMTS